MCLIRVTKVDVQSLSRPDLLFFISHPTSETYQYQILFLVEMCTFCTWSSKDIFIPYPVSHTAHPSWIFGFSRIQPNLYFDASKTSKYIFRA